MAEPDVNIRSYYFGECIRLLLADNELKHNLYLEFKTIGEYYSNTSNW